MSPHKFDEMNVKHPVSFVAGEYEKERFYDIAKGLEDVKEGGERCMRCYELRLKEAALVFVFCFLSFLSL